MGDFKKQNNFNLLIHKSYKPYISDFVQEKFVPEVRLARTLVMAMAELRLFVNQIKEIGTL